MPRLYDAGVDRPDGNLMHAFTFDPYESIVVAGERMPGRAVEVLAQRKYAVGPAAVPQPFTPIGVALRRDPDQIEGRALHPVRCRIEVGYAGIMRLRAGQRHR